ncbi:MAG TPA: efflux RND transporter periplasmic adaptor subunit [Candidatus Scalindua sp.]|jgi:cobalt-zinc-cadmium efflux system membrane fusion protein|nr:efflux RND transporter periplasmic adaptor subunit [Candidatus Scalindua sp.]
MKKNSKFLIFNMILLIGVFLSASLLSQFKSERAYADQTEETSLTKNQKEEDKQNPKRLWCNAHSVYEDECYICHPELRPEGDTIRDPSRLWCNEHSVYEDECFICHPELKSKVAADVETPTHDHRPAEAVQNPKRLWCNEHGVYEDECYICHPELRPEGDTIRDPNRLWCNVHSVYEDECYICRPGLKSKKSEEQSAGLYCKEHEVYESECGICHPELSNSLSIGQGLKIRLESPESAVKAGIITNVLSRGETMPRFTVLSRVIYNQNRFAHITSLASGIFQKVLVDVGAFVSEDEVLVEIASPDVARIKAEYLTALTNKRLKKLVFEREEKLFNKKVASQHEYQRARAEYDIARNNTNTTHQQLLNFGLSEDEIQDIEETQTSTSTLPIRASFSGTIVERHAVVGEFVKPGNVIFSLVDLSTMWLELSIPENNLPFFKVGDKVEASFNKEYGINKIQGFITWLASNIDEESRMLKGRAVVKNPDAFLKHGMFGEVQLLSQHYSKKINVPAKSVQRLDGKNFVFIKLSDDLFEARRVETGESDKENIEIFKGLSPLDELVVDGSFTLKSELLKSKFGEGCAH